MLDLSPDVRKGDGGANKVVASLLLPLLVLLLPSIVLVSRTSFGFPRQPILTPNRKKCSDR